MISVVHRHFVATILNAGVEIRAHRHLLMRQQHLCTSLHKEHVGYFLELSYWDSYRICLGKLDYYYYYYCYY